jgi:archaeosine synthase
LRFFQPLSQIGLSRLLGETRTHHPLTPGLISIESTIEKEGYSAFFDLPFPPSISTKRDYTEVLFWNLPDTKVDKSLAKGFFLSEQPFYPSYVPETLSIETFSEYIDKFQSFEEAHKQIFTLPLSYVESPLLDKIIETDCSLYTLTGISALFNNQRKLTETFVKLRERLPPDVALYLPGPISPAHYSFLVYSGIDLFDNSIAYYTSKNGYFLTSDGVFSVDNHPPCYCKYCNSVKPELLKHNEMVLKNAIGRIQYAMKTDTLRSLVEQDIHSSVAFAASLRLYDTNYSESIRTRTPIISSAPLKCIGEESFSHPSVIEFRKRVKERYTPDPLSNIVLLLPCSAKKPYSFSRSHMLFRKALKDGSKELLNYISELIITSPLSIVPRELENIFPARFYDIPVTGKWSLYEIDETRLILLEILKRYPKETIILNHTYGDGYNQVTESIEETTSFEVINTSNSSQPTSKNSLTKLSSTLKEISQREIKPKEKSRVPQLKQIRAIADFQYGPGSGKLLFSNTIKFKGKYPRDRQIFSEKKQVATLHKSTGFLSVFPQHAQKIVHHSYNNLKFMDDYVKGSNIYAPGCAKADNRIHPNDEIFVISNNKIIASATAFVSGLDMNKMTSGKLAEIKKKVRN